MAASDEARVELLGRPDCHLCDEARSVVETVCTGLGVGWRERDLPPSGPDRDRWWDKIPVIFVDGDLHAYWRVDADRLGDALSVTPSPKAEP